MKTIFTSLALFGLVSMAAQDRIKLENPSFEGAPATATVPKGWISCGVFGETPSDIHPSRNSRNAFFGVTRPAYDGETYVGMVARDNDTYEAIGQDLSMALEPGKAYKFSMFLCMSGRYISVSRATGEQANYDRPIILQIWGGSGKCSDQELLAYTVPVDHTDWLRYDFEFVPENRVEHIMFRAFYNDPKSWPYNGNILLDYSSDILEVPKKEIPDFDTLSNAQLLTIMEECQDLKSQDAPAYAPNAAMLHRVSDFFLTVETSGLEAWLLSTSRSGQIITIRCLEAIGANEASASLKRAIQDAADPEVLKVENDTLLSLETEELVIAYLEKHKAKILTEMPFCY